MSILNQLKQWQERQAQKEGIEGYMVLPFATLNLIAKELPQNDEELLAIKGIGPAKVSKYGVQILGICQGRGVAISADAEYTSNSAFTESDDVNALLDSISHVDLSYEDVQVGGGEEIFTETKNQNLDNSSVTNSNPNFDANFDPKTGEMIESKLPQAPEKILSTDTLNVADFLEQLNSILGSYFKQVRVRGEVTGFKRNQNGHAYFELKDGAGIMRCSVFKYAYDLSGVSLADGMEVVITGSPSHHKQYGFSFIGSMVELTGEGALKKAYEELKLKLQSEGLMRPEKKRALPDLPTRIGLITSPTGAAIGDFTMNVGSYGYEIKFYPSSVEGAKAVSELSSAIDMASKDDLDVLIITRGGGSLESLQAFNNENIVRKIADFPAPVIAGIGHEQDETISTLVADLGVSTPTAAARAVRSSWDGAVERFDRIERTMLENIDRSIRDSYDTLRHAERSLYEASEKFIQLSEKLQSKFQVYVDQVAYRIEAISQQQKFYAQLLEGYDPRKQLKMGYSIIRDSTGRIVRKKSALKTGDKISIDVSDGSARAEIL